MGRCKTRWFGAMQVVLTAMAIVIASDAGAQQTAVTPAATVVPVNTGDGNQTDPHVSGNLVSYTSSVSGTTQIRYFDLATSTDYGIPTNGWSYDFLSGVSGTRIVFTRVQSGSQSIWMLDTSVDAAPHEIDPQPTSARRAASIGGDTIAWQDLGFDNGSIQTSEIVIYDLASGVATRLTNDALVDRNVEVAPGGNVIVWEKCATTISGCDIWQAVKSGGVWAASPVTATPDPEAFPHTNGILAVYGASRAGNATGTDIYWTPIAGGAEVQLALPGIQRNPNISGNLIVFESLDITDPTPNWDTYGYDVSTAVLYRITNTPTLDETLNAVSVTGTEAHVAYAVLETTQNVYAQVFTLLPATHYDFAGTGGFQSPISNPPAMNVVTAGRVVPVKWQLRDASGAYVSDLGAVTGVLTQPIACDAVPDTFDAAVTAETTGNSGLRYDSVANQFVFNWATTKDMAGRCYAFVLSLGDGARYAAYFRFKI